MIPDISRLPFSLWRSSPAPVWNRRRRRAVDGSGHLARRSSTSSGATRASPRAYYRLGDAYIQKARETGDLSYLTLAEKALRKSLEIGARQCRRRAPPRLCVLVHAHEFGEAAAQALKAIALDPEDGDAYGVLGDAYLELGRYDGPTRRTTR